MLLSPQHFFLPRSLLQDGPPPWSRHFRSRSVAILPETKNMGDSLPISVLASIFATLVASICVPTRQLIYASHVSGHWRKAALSCRSLWSSIDLSQLTFEAAHVFLERSMAAPLRVKLECGPRKKQWTSQPGLVDSLVAFLEKLGEHGSRLESLEIRLPKCHETLVIGRLDFHAPRLRSLSISVCQTIKHDPDFGGWIPTRDDPNYYTYNKWPSCAARLPDTFLGGQLASLRTLKLQFFSIWNPSLFPNITHLVLSGQNVRPSVTKFVECLSNCSLLEDLKMNEAGPVRAVKSTKKAVLDRLRFLTIEECSTSLVLSHLALPAHTHISLSNPPGWKQEMFMKAREYFDRIFSSVLPAEYPDLRVVLPDKNQHLKNLQQISRMRFHYQEIGPDHEGGAPGRLSIQGIGNGSSFTIRTSHYGQIPLLTSCLNSLPNYSFCYHLSELWLNYEVYTSALPGDVDLDIAEWEVLLLALPALTKLAHINETRGHVRTALFEALGPGAKQTTRICPVLTTIHISDALRPGAPLATKRLTEYQHMARHRAILGRPFQTLSFINLEDSTMDTVEIETEIRALSLYIESVDYRQPKCRELSKLE